MKQKYTRVEKVQKNKKKKRHPKVGVWRSGDTPHLAREWEEEDGRLVPTERSTSWKSKRS